jgi:hypothetical protein
VHQRSLAEHHFVEKAAVRKAIAANYPPPQFQSPNAENDDDQMAWPFIPFPEGWNTVNLP